MTRSRYKIHNKTHPHFLTCTVVAWLPIFTRPVAVDIILNSWRFLIARKRLELFAYVIMENHLHFVARSDDLEKEVGDFKSFTARQILDELGRRGEKQMLEILRAYKADWKHDREFQLWQEGSHPEEIQGDDMMRQKIEYSHLNPVRRGYVDKATDWRCSSARNYERRHGLIEVTTNW